MASNHGGKWQGTRGAAAVILAALMVLMDLVGAFGAARPTLAQEKTAAAANAVETEVIRYLDDEFCRDGLCGPGAWQTWVIVEPDSAWRVEELALLHETLRTTIRALDEVGFDGRALLRGYRFRRQSSAYVDGLIARVNHDAQVVTLADTAVQQLWGFYLYHELGHIVDRRLHLSLRQHYHTLAGSDTSAPSAPTADGYWMNDHGRSNQGEAAADAFGLWVVMRHTGKPKPVFAHMPNDTDYEQIATTLETVLCQIGDQRSGRIVAPPWT